MTDYGQDLLLGAFLTPLAAGPAAVVDLAVHCEDVGLDLVTFQDHPYQPRFLDAWTLLTWVAARTHRVRLALDVTNLPLRPPAVLARAAASLDLLSGGRFELALGAGAYWDAIEAMGGTRLSPGQAVQALDEAIDVVRGIWDVDATERLRVAGEHHRLDGAKRGPAPAHPIGIWLGAYKPRMLRLTGARADGWLPSLGRMTRAEITAGHAAVDAAARDAGRDPASVRRLLNVSGTFATTGGDGLLVGPPELWVERLASLTLEEGFSTYILGSDDAATLRTFGEQVAPALRAAVAAGRAGSISA